MGRAQMINDLRGSDCWDERRLSPELSLFTYRRRRWGRRGDFEEDDRQRQELLDRLFAGEPCEIEHQESPVDVEAPGVWQKRPGGWTLPAGVGASALWPWLSYGGWTVHPHGGRAAWQYFPHSEREAAEAVEANHWSFLIWSFYDNLEWWLILRHEP